MLYYLYEIGQQNPDFSFLRLFRYVTFRSGLAALIAFLIVALLGKQMVRLLHQLKVVSPPRHDPYAENVKPGEMCPTCGEIKKAKGQVPSMGGVLMVFATVAAILLCAIPSQTLVLIFIGLIIGMCLIGLLDDYLKVHRENKDGLSSMAKFSMQVVVAVTAVYLLDRAPETAGYVRTLMVPLLKDPVVTGMPLWIALAFGVLVVVGASNAVNLSDGVDGLAAGCTAISALTYAIFAYACGTSKIVSYLLIPYVPGSTEVAVIACAMAGASLGFLWHNCSPASMYMGDTGSLALGGAIGLIAVLVKQELILVVVGGIFVVETGSVILQVGWFKLSRLIYGEPRRIFLCTPFHHHLERLGWESTQIVVRFWIIAMVLAGIGLATLKIR